MYAFHFIFADKVFGPTSQTDIVYEQGTKAVALSALAGINGNTDGLFYLHKIVEMNW